jgi:hypothetical protein
MFGTREFSLRMFHQIFKNLRELNRGSINFFENVKTKVKGFFQNQKLDNFVLYLIQCKCEVSGLLLRIYVCNLYVILQKMFHLLTRNLNL